MWLSWVKVRKFDIHITDYLSLLSGSGLHGGEEEGGCRATYKYHRTLKREEDALHIISAKLGYTEPAIVQTADLYKETLFVE